MFIETKNININNENILKNIQNISKQVKKSHFETTNKNKEKIQNTKYTKKGKTNLEENYYSIKEPISIKNKKHKKNKNKTKYLKKFNSHTNKNLKKEFHHQLFSEKIGKNINIII